MAKDGPNSPTPLLFPPPPSTPTGVFITPQTRLDQAISLHSDLWKDTYGVRPRGRFIFPASDDEAGIESLAEFVEAEIQGLLQRLRQRRTPPSPVPADTWSDLTYNPFAGLAALL